MRRSPIATRKRSLAAAPESPPPPAPRLDDQLCFPLYAASRLVVQAYTPLLDELGLTYPQYLVLMVLWEQDGCSVHEIGERLYLDSGTLTPILKRLDAAGLVRRERGREDERLVDNFLTRAGRALERRAALVPRELLCRLGMPLRDFKQMHRSLWQLLGMLSRMVAEPPA